MPIVIGDSLLLDDEGRLRVNSFGAFRSLLDYDAFSVTLGVSDVLANSSVDAALRWRPPRVARST